MNSLHIGFSRTVPFPKRGFLLIDDKPPEIPRARVFESSKHSFNPLKKKDYKKAREVAELIYTLYPQGADTLTVRNGKRELLQALLKADRLDRIESPPPRRGEADEVGGIIQDLLTSPVLRHALCTPTNFPFRPTA
jgi:hypothetical protein